MEVSGKLSTAAEAGLLGFALAPDFPTTRQAFAYYTYTDGSGQFNRIVTLQLEGNIWKERALLLDKIPSGPVHHGGRLKIGPDGKLYATTGDASNAGSAQDLTSLGGKILRMNLDGSVPGDNPFPRMQTTEAVSGLGRIRDVFIEDDFLYMISNNTDGRGTPLENDDKLYRIPLSD